MLGDLVAITVAVGWVVALAVPRWRAESAKKAAALKARQGGGGSSLAGPIILLTLHTGGLALVVIIPLFLYLLPWYIASQRQHPQTSPIALLDVLLGWTLLGPGMGAVSSPAAPP